MRVRHANCNSGDASSSRSLRPFPRSFFPAKPNSALGNSRDEVMIARKKAGSSKVSAQPIAVELIAVLVAVAEGRPLAMTIDGGRALPPGPFEVGHRSLQLGPRAWVERQTQLPLGYVEPLYTVADSDRRGGGGCARRGHVRR